VKQNPSKMNPIRDSSSRGEVSLGWRTIRFEVSSLSIPSLLSSLETRLWGRDADKFVVCEEDSNTSQFFITLNQTPELQGKHVSRSDDGEGRDGGGGELES